MDDFKLLIDALEKYKEETLIEAVFRGIWKLDSSNKKKTFHALSKNGEDFSEADSDEQINYYADSEETIQAFDVIYRWFNDEIFEFIPDTSEFRKKIDSQNLMLGWPNGEQILDDLEAELFPRLVNLYTILDSSNGPHPGQVFQEILWNGCYGYSTFPSYNKFNSTSKQVPKALAAIGMYAKYADHYEYWDWLDQDNPLYDYGWPKEELPKFRWYEEYPDQRIIDGLETLTSIYKDGIHTVAKILWLEQASPVAVNKAILKHGIWKITSLGSSVFMGPEKFVEDDKIEITLSTDLLQKSLVAFAKPLLAGEKLSVEMLDVNEGALSNYGWPSEHLPSFEIFFKDLHPDPPSTQQKEQSQEVAVDAHDAFSKDSKANEPFMPAQVAPTDDLSPRNQKGWELLVMTLVAFIRGEIPNKDKLDPYKNQKDLQSLISQRSENILGLQQTSIDKKLGLANAHRPKIGLPPIKDAPVDYHLKHKHDLVTDKK